MGGKKNPGEPFMGETGLARAIEEGRDPNADLDSPEKQKSRGEAALALVLAGASWTRAAEVAGYSSPRHCRSAVERILATSADSTDSRELMRALQDRRYKRLLQSVMPKAVDPDDKDHLAYNARAMAILDRISKTWGLDAALEINVTPSDERIAEMLDRIREVGAAEQEAEEGDILDAEFEVRREEDAEDAKEEA